MTNIPTCIICSTQLVEQEKYNGKPMIMKAYVPDTDYEGLICPKCRVIYRVDG